MMKTEQISATEAWAKTLSAVLLTPFLVIGIGGTLLSLAGPQSFHFFWFVFSAFGLVVHFAAYFVFGLPIYQFFWKDCKSLWTWKIGVPIGTLLGGLVILLFYRWLTGPDFTFEEFRMIFLLGAFYGLVSAVGAIHSRRKNLK